MKTFFTSDPHFGHFNMTQAGKNYSNRPYKTVAEMDTALIANWNSVVGPEDTVYLLGDFVMGKTPAPTYLAQLNGIIHFIWGNHDSNQTRHLPRWASSQPYLEIILEGRKIILCHYAMRVWNGSHKGNLMFYGHSHGSLPGNDQSCDVGVDCFNYTPATLEQILRHLKTLPPYRPVDHHGRKDTGKM
jgi:calcineurin-like phosphoesterase family protein